MAKEKKAVDQKSNALTEGGENNLGKTYWEKIKKPRKVEDKTGWKVLPENKAVFGRK